MSKELLTFDNNEIEKKEILLSQDSHFWGGDVDIEKVLVSARFIFTKKTKSTLLATCILIIKLNHEI